MTALLIIPRRFSDDRGWFSEVYQQSRWLSHGVNCTFVQDNHSYSAQAGTLRGIHFQRPPFAQAKLVRCTRGRIFDVAVDLRRDSPTFGQWVGTQLSAEHGEQLFVPSGYGHAFLTLEPDCEVQYKVDAYYDPSSDGGICWDDDAIGIAWPAVAGVAAPILSAKDAALPTIANADFAFPYDGQPLLPLAR